MTEETPERLYTLEEVARHLKLSVRTVKRFVAGGKLHVRHFGRAARVSADEFARFLREGTHPPEPKEVSPSSRERLRHDPGLDRRLVYEVMRHTIARKPRKT